MKSEKRIRIEDSAIAFAKRCHKLHSTVSRKKSLSSKRQEIVEIAHAVNGYNSYTRKVAIKFLADIPECNTLVHGKLQKEVLNTDEKWLDDSGFAHGDPILDIASLYFYFATGLGRFRARHLFHMKDDDLSLFWNTFIISYASYSDKYTVDELIVGARRALLLYYMYSIDHFDKNKKIISLLMPLFYYYVNWFAESFDV